VDFEDTPEEAAFRAEARAWLDEHAPLKGSPEDFSTGYLEGTMSDEEHTRRQKTWQRTLFDHGWAGITWPKAFGGRGGTPLQSAIFTQEHNRYGVSVGAFSVGIGMAGPTIMRHGTEEQKARFLRPMLRGEELWCQLFSEPGAGSDLAGVSTRAVEDGDEWVVTGQKVWTSMATESEWGILLARTDPDAPKHKGITYFLVDMASPGFDIRPLRQMTGASHFSEVFLDEVRIPADQVLGDVHGGWGCAITTLSNERGLIAGGNRASDTVALIAHAQKLGRSDDPVLRQALVDCWTRQQIQRYLGFRAQTALSQGRAPGPETSIMKLFAAEYLRRLGDTALSMLGADGMVTGSGWTERFLHAPSIRIAGGSNEIQRNIVGERVLGLPREAQTDREAPFRDLAKARA
jgi:alkylation response protein AidB-like acyl-CoA dehydrogenase